MNRINFRFAAALLMVLTALGLTQATASAAQLDQHTATSQRLLHEPPPPTAPFNVMVPDPIRVH